MDDTGMDLITEMVDVLKETQGATVAAKEKKYGIKIKASNGVVIKVFDMSLEVNNLLQNAQPATAIIDSRLCAAIAFRIFNSFEVMPRVFFFEDNG